MLDLLMKAGINGPHQFGASQGYIDQLAGMEPISPHAWRWSVGESDTDVRFDPGGNLRISQAVADLPDGRVGLEATRGMPGNLRYAMRGSQTFLIADTQLDGVAHLSRSFEEMKAGLLSAGGQPWQPNDEPKVAPEAVSAAIGVSEWPEDFTVEREAGWEFRPRRQGDATPVQAVIDGAALRIFRVVVRIIEEPLCAAAVCAEALRFNDRLRHARLAWSDRTIVAEARLHSKQLTPSWMETAARAVAVASRYSEHVLGILAEEKKVAELYADAFWMQKS